VSASTIAATHMHVPLAPAPLDPSWIIAGTPTARCVMVSAGRDGTPPTFVWECTPGSFVWHYRAEETIHFVEGAAVLDDGTGPRRVGPGDIVFIRGRSKVRWDIEQTVRKFAFLTPSLPLPVALLMKGLRRAKRFVQGANGEAPGLLGGQPAPQPGAVMAGSD